MNKTDNQNSDEPLDKSPIILLLLDGWGIAPASEANLISLSKTPNFNRLIRDYPSALLRVRKKSLNARYLSLGSGRHLEDESTKISPPLSEVISLAGYRQIKIGDSNRLAALTYFFNGGNENKFLNEDWKIISASLSDRKKPLIVINKIFKEVSLALKSGEFRFMVVALPYLDLVSQEGDLSLMKKTVEAVDKSLGRLASLALDNSSRLLISAACGNAERVKSLVTDLEDKNITDNPIPLIIVEGGLEGKTFGLSEPISGDLSLLAPIGGLDDLAPTILEMLGLKIPAEMTGKSLLSKNN